VSKPSWRWLAKIKYLFRGKEKMTYGFEKIKELTITEELDRSIGY
jgi:hypothetical protein